MLTNVDLDDGAGVNGGQAGTFISDMLQLIEPGGALVAGRHSAHPAIGFGHRDTGAVATVDGPYRQAAPARHCPTI